MSNSAAAFFSVFAWDLRIQLRYYFWVAGFVITAVWLVLLRLMPADVVDFFVPVLLFVDTCTIGVMFIAGLLFLDRHQGTIETMAVMPMRTSTWLFSKVLSLSILCTACALSIVFFNAEGVNWFKTIPAVILSSIFYTSFGFILASPFQKVLNYFLAMAVALGVLALPVFGYFDVLSTSILWVMPTQPVMVVLASASDAAASSAYYTALFVLFGWTIVTFWLAKKSFHHFVSDRMEG